MVVSRSQPILPADHAEATRDYVKCALCTWASVKLKSVNFYFFDNLHKP